MSNSLTVIASGLGAALTQLPELASSLKGAPSIDPVTRDGDDADVERCLCALLGIPDPLPAAALTWSLDFDKPLPTTVLRADPVFMQAMSNGLVLEPFTQPLTDSDRASLLATLQPLLDDLGATLMAGEHGRWYVLLQALPDASFTSPLRAAESGLGEAMPTGSEGARWSRVLSEIQIELHQCEFNRARLEAEEPGITSLWFWGASESDSVTALTEPATLGGNHRAVASIGLPASAGGVGVEIWSIDSTQALDALMSRAQSVQSGEVASMRLIDPGVSDETIVKTRSWAARLRAVLGRQG